MVKVEIELGFTISETSLNNLILNKGTERIDVRGRITIIGLSEYFVAHQFENAKAKQKKRRKEKKKKKEGC